jgi:hypothetical protein
MIEERRRLLEKYFSIVINDPVARGTKEVKRFIYACKHGSSAWRAMSCGNPTLSPELEGPGEPGKTCRASSSLSFLRSHQ